jgi:hypothetical protein
MILRAVVNGRLALPPVEYRKYFAFVDMSHGSQDDACLSIAHREDKKIIVDLVTSQGGKPPFSANDAIKKFAGILRNEYHTSHVVGDAVGGQTYRLEFAKYEISYKVCDLSASELYEQFEVALNNGELELPDQAKLIQQLVLLINKTGKITHPVAEHDDWPNAVAGAVAVSKHRLTHISDSVKQWASVPQRVNGRWFSIGSRRHTLMTSSQPDRGYEPPRPYPVPDSPREYPRSPGMSVNERLPEMAANITFSEAASYLKKERNQ